MRFLQLHRTYAACLLAALALGASCTKTVYDEGQQTESPAISLSVTEAAQTRAMIDKINDDTNFDTEGNRIQVYDFWTKTDGGIKSEYKYIDAYAGPEVGSNSSQHITGTTWPFVDKSSGKLVRYNWTSTGVHKFFGRFAVDATTEDVSGNMTAESFFGSGFSFNETEKELTIPAKTLDQSTPQFDFLYSDINSVDVINGVPSIKNVPMSFSHLFAAVSFGAKNTSASDVKILEFRVENLYNTNSATIDFSGSTPSVDYADGVQGNVFRSVAYSEENPLTLLKDGTINNIFGQQPEFLLIWPQKTEQLHIEDNDPDSYKMYVKYTVGTETFEKRINFDNTLAWEEGKKYHYDIIFDYKMVELKCIVNPWNYVLKDIHYIPSIERTITWNKNPSTDGAGNNLVYITNGQDLLGTFCFKAPEGGRWTWIATLEGDIDAFQLFNGEGPAEGPIDGKDATVTVHPRIQHPDRDYKVKLRFFVRNADGEIFDVDDSVQPVKYTIVLPKN